MDFGKSNIRVGKVGRRVITLNGGGPIGISSSPNGACLYKLGRIFRGSGELRHCDLEGLSGKADFIDFGCRKSPNLSKR